MQHKINPINLVTNSTDYIFEYKAPGKCPCCHTAVDAKVLNSYHFINENGKASVFILYFCCSCDQCFLGSYFNHGTSHSYRNTLDLQRLIPYGEETTNFSENINKLSPIFVKTFHQSQKAEQIGLNEISGIGYRKSLEFLIKDYAIKISPKNEASIISSQLSPCIQEHIDNKRIKSLATASAWIGNDETHYTRKHEDYGIEHLKAFVSAVVSYVDSELSYFDAEALLNKPKTK
jgi:hypothetical protein